MATARTPDGRADEIIGRLRGKKGTTASGRAEVANMFGGPPSGSPSDFTPTTSYGPEPDIQRARQGFTPARPGRVTVAQDTDPDPTDTAQRPRGTGRTAHRDVATYLAAAQEMFGIPAPLDYGANVGHPPRAPVTQRARRIGTNTRYAPLTQEQADAAEAIAHPGRRGWGVGRDR